ncbi:MAG TPA: hypothetical protein VEC14_02780 [Reyranellaceae bacterium]|nr:hypothetical protein [Reyranellaceae bacterium]
MTLRPEYALGNSPYNEFLFAAVGEEKAGQSLTVLSALARLGFDPWTEAARLAALPREAAARAFAVTIAMLPEGDWQVTDADIIATRLVRWLPKPGDAAARVPTKVVAAQHAATPAKRRWLFWAALAVAGLAFGLVLQPETLFEPPRTTTAPNRL